MTTQQTSIHLNSDRPLENPKDDLLGYDAFARNLAEGIFNTPSPEGLVVALYGVWGSGKSTVLNFVKKYLADKKPQQRPTIVSFNPWWFSTDDDLARNFLLELRSQLDGAWSKRGNSFRQKLQPLAILADLVGEVPIPVVSSTAKAAAKGVKALKPAEINVQKLKARVGNLLKKNDKRIVVFVDDIDRLTDEQIRQVFRVIKALADFPNVVYVLAFDRAVVARALTTANRINGNEYLEKIVQVPFDLPLPEENAIHQLLTKGLDDVVGKGPDGVFDQEHWAQVYNDGLRGFFQTPRNVIRLLNSLLITYPPVSQEVNPIDFIAIETLRIFETPVYETIRRNRDMFAGTLGPNEFRAGQIASHKPFHEAWLGIVSSDRQKFVKALVTELFPKLKGVWSTSSYGSEPFLVWRRQMRIVVPESFDVYFRLAVPTGKLTNQELQAIVSSAFDENRFATTLLNLAHTDPSKLRTVLDRLQDFVSEEIPIDNIPAVVSTLISHGDEFDASAKQIPKTAFDIPSSWYRYFLVVRLLQRIDEAARFQLLSHIFTTGAGLSSITDQLISLGHEHGLFDSTSPKPESERLVNTEQLSSLSMIVVNRIRTAADDGSLWQATELVPVLRVWRDLSIDEEVVEWVKNQCKNDSKLILFLRKLGTHLIVVNDGRRGLSLNLAAVKPYLDPENVLTRLKAMLQGDKLNQDDEKLIKMIIEGYDSMKDGNQSSNEE